MANKAIPITQHHLDDSTLPVVSISCMTYNHENFIGKTIEGFMMQKTTFPVKINIFEDCSTDKTASIIKKYQKKYPNLFNVFFQPENTWRKPIRRQAMKPFFEAHVKSKYLAICEGDDYWIDPLKLQKQVDFLERNEDYGIVYTEIDRVDEKGDIIDQSFFKNDPASFCKTFDDYLIYAPFRAPCTWLYRTRLYRDRKKTYIVGDLPRLLDLLATSKIHFIEDTTAHYRVLTKSASHFTTIEQEYNYMKGIYEIQTDYAKNYRVCKDIIEIIKINYAVRSYNFAVAQNDLKQIKCANLLLKNHHEIAFKFKTLQFIGKFKLARALYSIFLNKRLGN